MDRTALVSDGIELGREVTQALNDANIPVRASFWIYVSEAEEWRLAIASPIVDAHGPKHAYESVHRVLINRNLSDRLPLRKLWLMSPHHRLVEVLGHAVVTGPGIHGIRFANNTINNVLIEDAYVYRLEKPAPTVEHS